MASRKDKQVQIQVEPGEGHARHRGRCRWSARRCIRAICYKSAVTAVYHEYFWTAAVRFKILCCGGFAFFLLKQLFLSFPLHSFPTGFSRFLHKSTLWFRPVPGGGPGGVSAWSRAPGSATAGKSQGESTRVKGQCLSLNWPCSSILV